MELKPKVAKEFLDLYKEKMEDKNKNDSDLIKAKNRLRKLIEERL